MIGLGGAMGNLTNIAEKTVDIICGDAVSTMFSFAFVIIIAVAVRRAFLG